MKAMKAMKATAQKPLPSAATPKPKAKAMKAMKAAAQNPLPSPATRKAAAPTPKRKAMKAMQKQTVQNANKAINSKKNTAMKAQKTMEPPEILSHYHFLVKNVPELWIEARLKDNARKALLRGAEFVEQSCCDVDGDMQSAVTRPAAPREDGEARSWSCTRVRLAVFTRSHGGSHPPRAAHTFATAGGVGAAAPLATKLDAGAEREAVPQGTLAAYGLVELRRGEADGTTSWQFAGS